MKVLSRLEQPNEWSWLQARARMAICDHLLSLASATTLQAGDDLKAWISGHWILQAEKQIQVIIQLQEPEYVMTSLEHFADSMVLFFDEVRMLPPQILQQPRQISLKRKSLNKRVYLLTRSDTID